MAVAPEMEQYLEAFLLEADVALAQLRGSLDRIAKEGAKLSAVDEAARAMANMKSAAATMGFRSIRDLAHATWDMLHAWRRGGVKNPAASLELLDISRQRLGEALGMLREGRGPEPPVSDLAIQLRALVTIDAENPWPEAEPGPLEGLAEQRFIIRLDLETPCPHPAGRFLVCQGYLLGLGKVIASDPPPDPVQDKVILRFLLATDRTLAEVRGVVETIPHLRKVEVSPATPELNSLPPPAQAPKKKILQDWTMEIEGRQLDDLTEIAAELVQIRSAYRALEHELETANPGLAFRLSRLGDRFEYPLRQLADTLSQLRKVPVKLFLGRLARYAQERAKTNALAIEARIAGDETCLSADRAEALLPPLQALLSILLGDTAREQAERFEAGKEKANRLELSAHEDQDKIVLNLSLDGWGIDLDEELGREGRLTEVRQRIENAGGTLDGQAWPG